MSRLNLTFLILAALLWSMRPAQPQVMGTAMPCHERAEIARQLGTGYDETPVSLGVQANGDLLEVFSSAQTGTWTIVSTAPSGLACVVAAGDGWQTRGDSASFTALTPL